MNHLKNGTVAVGVPGSLARRRAEQEDEAKGEKFRLREHIRQHLSEVDGWDEGYIADRVMEALETWDETNKVKENNNA